MICPLAEPVIRIVDGETATKVIPWQVAIFGARYVMFLAGNIFILDVIFTSQIYDPVAYLKSNVNFLFLAFLMQ